MQYATTTGKIRHTFDEMGKGCNVGLDCEIEYEISPGYPASWDDPGEPAGFERLEIRVLRFADDSIEFERHERPDWFTWMDEIVSERVCHKALLDRIESMTR